MDAMAEEEEDVNGSQKRPDRRQRGHPDPSTTQEPQGDEAESTQGDERQGVAGPPAQESGGAAEGRPHEPRHQGDSEVGRHAGPLRQRRQSHGAEHTRPALVEGLAPGGISSAAPGSP